SYHGIAVINRALSAQITPLFYVSCAADHVIQRTVMPLIEQCEKITGSDYWIWEWLKQTVRWDEIGFLEKEAVWQWCNGLAMSVAFTPNQPVLATTLAYGLATTTSQMTVSLIDYAAPYWDLSPEIVGIAQVAAHMAVYTLAYRQGFQWAHQLGLIPENEMSQAEALKTLGLTMGASERQVKQRYRELAKQFHPDKCSMPECAAVMLQVNAAQEILTKKMQ
ncbi:MAG: J domain-containing protein, partial [Proteobacteria bacterium]|nr:J domain-containing protein [Pseudomonadota bacterium]